jgi:transcriptional regulator with XRE-family HTH domain
MTMHFLGKNLRYLRRQSAKTQSEIASLIQKGQTTIGNWENGISEPSLNELLIISNYFDISIDLLLKTDLSVRQAPDSHRQPGVVPPYDHTPMDPSTTNEQDNPSKNQDNPSKNQDNPSKERDNASWEQNNLSKDQDNKSLWQAIRNIRAEMEQIQAQLPGQKPNETKNGQS